MLKQPLIISKTKTIDREDDSPRGVTPPLMLPFPFPVPEGTLPILVGINLLSLTEAPVTGGANMGLVSLLLARKSTV
jgi:hypothetical protein